MTVPHRFTAIRFAGLLIVAGLAGCSSVDGFLSGDKIDYKSAGATRERGLEVPPDLTQLQRESRFQPAGGSVSAAQYQAGTTTATAAANATVAPKALGEVRMEREGNQRWLVVPMTPDQLWPQLQAFWKERGFTLLVDQAEAGVMETDWAENRAKLPQDIIRSTIGKVFDSFYSTGERDKFRTRVERQPNGSSEVYLTHRGLVEVFSGDRKETTVWQPRPDPQLEAEMLQRIMLRLGVKEEQAKATTVATGGTTLPARARIVANQPTATLQVDDNFDRAWRRVGLALDRSGFTVEDRDRAQGVYFVRYVDPAQAGKDEPGFMSRLFSFGRKKDELSGPARYRVQVKGDGDRSTVTVLNGQGQPENGDAGKRIVGLLVEDLK
ncbi:outer membrane protein assembly factor BamC [Piscinibacter sp. XHJ-5]|uniref:outer membrane protein assembly factor BamC n=1 Tax=Piscinibacter sp. XHJ-5 TaxID=3037797 RepID=UPI00245339D9|nr:outer membrane protein assembly factor BamC [Piscinibacter sp. XHJ-5]